MPSGHHKNPRHASYSESGPNRPAARNLRVDKSREIDLLLDQSERQGLCLATKDRCLRKALLTRACAGMLVSPAPGLFARASHWHGLTPSAKSLHIMRGMHRLHPSWVFSHVSAAVAWGLSVPYRVQGLVHVATPADSHSRSSPTIKRHCIPPGLAPALVNGIPVNGPRLHALPGLSGRHCRRRLGPPRRENGKGPAWRLCREPEGAQGNCRSTGYRGFFGFQERKWRRIDCPGHHTPARLYGARVAGRVSRPHRAGTLVLCRLCMGDSDRKAQHQRECAHPPDDGASHGTRRCGGIRHQA